MAFRVAADCLDGEKSKPVSVFCSRYGEIARAVEILTDITNDEPVSPMTFSLSVHNTASSLFSIMRQDRTHSTTLASGEATLEAGFLECWTLLREQAAPTALLVCSDDVLPEVYSDQKTNVTEPAALALLLGLPDGSDEAPDEASAIGLSWRASESQDISSPGCSSPGCAENAMLGVLRLLLAGGDPIEIDSGRLRWTWSCHGSTA